MLENAHIEKALRQQRELTAAVVRGIPVDLSEDDRNYWNENQGVLNEQLGRLLRRQNVTQVGSILVVTVDYAMTLPQMIAAGKYDWVNSDITQKNFPIEPSGAVEVPLELVDFGRSVGSDEVLAEFDRRGLRAATLPELLALGAAYPDLQRQFPIVALGSVWQDRDGDRLVPVLGVDDDGRDLGLDWFEREWHDDYRFFAVRK